MASPAGSRTRGGRERRSRLIEELPRALESQEARLFALAKRLEAAGDAPRAVALFELSRQAYEARRAILHPPAGSDLDEALERGNQLLLKMAHT